MALPSRADLEEVAHAAGRLALGHFRRVAAERKADRSLVTAADREVEAYLVEHLGPLMPEAGILGEEGAARPAAGPYRIVIDPIDGTAAFVSGLPTWCVCVGVLRGADPVAGIVHLPCTGETYVASDGRAWWNGTELAPLGGADSTGDRFIVTDGKAHARRRITYRGKVRSLGSGAYHVALVARGAAEVALLGSAHLWDLVAPGALLAVVGGRYEFARGGVIDLATLAGGQRATDEVLAGTAAAIERLRAPLGGA